MLLVIQSRIQRYCIIGLSMSWWLCLLKVCILNYRSLPVLSRLLKNDDLDVRTAAGESIALLYEMTDSAPSTEEDAEDSADDEVPVARATIPEDQVVEQMKALSVHAGGKGAPKKERAVQRSSFRELLASIEVSPFSCYILIILFCE
jgi:hypothetical protein